MYKTLKKGVAAIALGASAFGGIAAAPASAERHDDRRHDDRRYDDWRGDDRRQGDRHDRDHQHGRDRDRDYDRVIVIHDRAPPRVVYRYDWDRPDPRYGRYHADRYYRAGYRPVVVTRRTRIYHGYDDRYYCRRSDGTTGLIAGAILGGVIGDRLDRGESSVLGAVLGAAIGRELDRANITCR